MSRLKLFLPLGIFVLLAVLFWRGLSLDPTAMPSALIDKPLPAFQLPTVNDAERIITQRDLQGEVTLLNVWATWCVACRVEHPFLNQLAEQGVRIVGVNYKDDVAAAQQWLQEFADPYLYSVVDADGRLDIECVRPRPTWWMPAVLSATSTWVWWTSRSGTTASSR